MKLKKEDYMRLPKERLAELLVERDMEDEINKIQIAPSYPYQPLEPKPWKDGITYGIAPSENANTR